MDPKILGMIRHILTLVGGILVALGVLTEETVSGISDAVLTITGAVISLIGFIASWKAPEKK